MAACCVSSALFPGAHQFLFLVTEPQKHTSPTFCFANRISRAMADETRLPPDHHTKSESHMLVSRTTYDLTISSPTSKDTVTIIVGEDPHTATFHLPKPLLAAKSSFVERALRPEWSNSVSNRTIRLPDIPPALSTCTRAG
jgi:hypothetical protein